jgi:hypothetical protein
VYTLATVSVVTVFIAAVVFAPSERYTRRLVRILRAWRRR